MTADRAFNGFGTNFEGSPEPLYGSVFLPRKFKVAITVPGDNSVDIFTNDVGIVVMTNDAGEVQGYNIVVGGGMGRTARWALDPRILQHTFAWLRSSRMYRCAAHMRTPFYRLCDSTVSCTLM